MMSSLSVVTARRVGDLYNIKRIVTTTPLSMLLKSAQGGVGDRFSIFYRRSNELKCRQTQTNFDATPLQSPLPLYAPVCLSVVCVSLLYQHKQTQTHTTTAAAAAGEKCKRDGHSSRAKKTCARLTKGAVRKKLRNHTRERLDDEGSKQSQQNGRC
jgi:hypothetical protein